MLVCEKCKRQLRCETNGVGINYGHGHVYASDRFICPECGATILKANDNAYYDINYNIQQEYVNMEKSEVA